MKPNFDEEESQILKQYTDKKLKKSSNTQLDIENAQNIARNTLNKSKHISIRLSEKDLQRLKIKAIEIGASYQTLIGVLIHQYIENKIRIRI